MDVDLVEAGAGGSASSSAGLATKEKAAKPSLAKRKSQKGKGFSPRDVLRDSKGNIIGGGDGPEAEGAKEFFAWLTGRGCLGLDSVMLRSGGGVTLRASAGTVPKNGQFFTVPRTAWLEATEQEGEEAEEALAWRLLQEVWRGPDSEYEPFVRQLQRKDVSAHPIMWTEKEVEWIAVSPEGFEAVNEQRATAEKRVGSLLQRARSAPEGEVPQALLEDERALAGELRWALSLVEVAGVGMEDSETGTSFAAFCPLMGDVRYTFQRKAPTVFQVTEKQLTLRAAMPGKPGDELLQKIEEDLPSGVVLANYGVVPGAEHLGVPSDEELLEMNMGATAMLQIVPLRISDFPPETCMGMKVNLLSEYAALELAEPRLPTTPVHKTAFKLPGEAIGRGRLLPTARFLISELQSLPGNIQDWMHRYFVRFFRHCKLDAGYPPVDQEYDVEKDKQDSLHYTSELEVKARQLVCEWLDCAILNYTAAVDRIAQETGLPTGSSAGVILVTPGQTVLSHFKSKRQDGSTHKSRTPREARVVSLGDSTVRLEFLANGRRHEVPSTWIVGAQPIPSAGLLQSGISPEAMKRGKLAITLLRTERSIMGYYLSKLSKSAEVLEGFLTKAQTFAQMGDVTNARKCANTVQDFLAKETMELDAETESLQPQSLDQMPQLDEDGQVVPNTDVNKPIWNMPSVGKDVDSESGQELLFVDGIPTDGLGRPMDLTADEAESLQEQQAEGQGKK